MPLYAQAEKVLEDLLVYRRYLVGYRIPPEVELVRSLGVSRATVRAGVGRLVDRGLLIKAPGRAQLPRPDTRTARSARSGRDQAGQQRRPGREAGDLHEHRRAARVEDRQRAVARVGGAEHSFWEEALARPQPAGER